VTGDPPEAAHVEKRLVDRDPLDQRVVSSNTAKTALLAST
jgi:hypothetical protein